MSEQTEVKRGPGRPPMREAARTSLRDRLRASAPKVLEFEHDDRFAIPGKERHEGVSLEWKKYSLKGEQDPFYIASLRRAGWEPMQAEDFPELPSDGSGSIIKDGMILMGRPQEMTDKSNALSLAKAQKQIHDQKVQLGLAPAGTLPRVNQDMSGKRMGIQTEVMRQVAVED